MTGRATTARPKAAKPKPSAPVQLKSRAKEQPREPLFSVDDVEYTMPVVVELGDALSLAALLRVQPDEDAKGMLLVRELCGRQALNALLADSTMTRGEWNTVINILMEKAFGPPEPEDDAGN